MVAKGKNSGRTEAQQRTVANLKPFKKGESGNPDGRPVGRFSMRSILQKAIEIKRDGIADPLNNGVPRAMTIGEELVTGWVASGLEGDNRAREKIFEQLEGKATQPISGPEGGPVQTETTFKLDEVSNGMIKAIGETLAKVKVG